MIKWGIKHGDLFFADKWKCKLFLGTFRIGRKIINMITKNGRENKYENPSLN